MAKYHINPNTGDSGSCKSIKGSCPFGREDEHFSNLKEASEKAEKLMAEQYSSDSATFRKGDASAFDGMGQRTKNRSTREANPGPWGTGLTAYADYAKKQRLELAKLEESEAKRDSRKAA